MPWRGQSRNSDGQTCHFDSPFLSSWLPLTTPDDPQCFVWSTIYHSLLDFSTTFLIWQFKSVRVVTDGQTDGWSPPDILLPPASVVEVIESVRCVSVCNSALSQLNCNRIRSIGLCVSIYHAKRTLGQRNFTTWFAGGVSTLRHFHLYIVIAHEKEYGLEGHLI